MYIRPTYSHHKVLLMHLAQEAILKSQSNFRPLLFFLTLFARTQMYPSTYWVMVAAAIAAAVAAANGHTIQFSFHCYSKCSDYLPNPYRTTHTSLLHSPSHFVYKQCSACNWEKGVRLIETFWYILNGAQWQIR